MVGCHEINNYLNRFEMVNKDLLIFLAVNYISDLHMKRCCSLQVAPGVNFYSIMYIFNLVWRFK